MPDAAKLEMAAEYKWGHPAVTWVEVANHVGWSRVSMWRVRQTEAWEIVFQKVGARHMEDLVPQARAALLTAWAKGNPANAIDILRSAGLIRREAVDLHHDGAIKTDKKEITPAFVAEVLRERDRREPHAPADAAPAESLDTAPSDRQAS